MDRAEGPPWLTSSSRQCCHLFSPPTAYVLLNRVVVSDGRDDTALTQSYLTFSPILSTFAPFTSKVEENPAVTLKTRIINEQNEQND